MRHVVAGAITVGLAGMLATGCASTPHPTRPAAAPAPATPGRPSAITLPPIPRVTGPLALTVVYPPPGATLTVRDSNFIFGSTGTGDAQLTVNGLPVPVQPNGAFLAWLPVPDSALSRYDLVATRGGDTARLTRTVLLPFRPAGGADTTTAVTSLPEVFSDSGRFVALDDADSSIDDTDRVAIGRPVPGGTYKWFLLPGTIVQVVGRAVGFTQVRLDSALAVWVANSSTRIAPVPAWTPPPRRVVGPVRVTPAAGWVDITFPLGDRPPFALEEDDTDLLLTLYGTQASTSAIQYVVDPASPPLVESVTWSQETSDRARFRIHLAEPPYGYLAMWNGTAFVLRVRRTPAINPATPLAGRTIVVDAGHPPAGATGPTGLYEAVATLEVSRILRDILIARGATVVMTRTTAAPLALTARPVMARRANADALVSIHLNALPDGMNPFTSHGTGTYFFQPHSLALARAVQAGMVRRLGLRDLGVFEDNLALVRPTWMPAILCEGAFIIIPEQEAALRTPEFQRAYAQGVADGIEAFFRELAARRPPA